MKSRHAALKVAWTKEFELTLKGLTADELFSFFDRACWFIDKYQFVYQMNRQIFLMLDNSIVQDFKKNNDPKRWQRALAYLCFCRFVSGWSDCPTHLVITPALLYEFRGRRPSDSQQDAENSLDEVRNLLSATGLRLALTGTSNIKALHRSLQDVHHDADFLEVFVKQIDSADWNRDLRNQFGGETIALSIAATAIPDDMPLKYFSPHYVSMVFQSRIEQLIADQSEGVLGSSPLRSGPISINLAALNEISKKDKLQGLGDLDLLQFCDITRQYQQTCDYVYLGQTYDRNLAKALCDHTILRNRTPILGGSKYVDDQIKNIALMTTKILFEENRRYKEIGVLRTEFLENIAETCKRLS